MFSDIRYFIFDEKLIKNNKYNKKHNVSEFTLFFQPNKCDLCNIFLQSFLLL